MLIRPAALDDAEQIVSLINMVFGLDRGREWFYHFHYDNPAGRSVMFVAEDRNGTIVSYRSIVKFRATYMGTGILCGQLSDACTHPDHRGRGLYGKVNRSAIEDFFSSGGDLVYSFPSRANYTILVSKFGFKHVMSMRHALFPLKEDCWSQGGLRVLSRLHSSVFQRSKCSPISVHPILNCRTLRGITISEYNGKVMSFDRSESIMRWRLLMPGRQYWIASLLEESSQAIIGEACRQGLRVCTVVSCKTQSVGASRRLLKGICAWANARDYDAVFIWLPMLDLQTLVRTGFMPAPSRTDFVARFRDDFELQDALSSAQRWHIELIDTDAY